MKLLIPLLVVFSMTSCISSRVENKTLIPAIQAGWPEVRVDVMAALLPPLTVVSQMDDAVESGEKALLRAVPFSLLEQAALEGIQNQLDRGTISAGLALSLLEQLRQFKNAMEYLQKPLFASVSPQVQELYSPSHRIALSPRTSWFLSPPSGIRPSYNR